MSALGRTAWWPAAARLATCLLLGLLALRLAAHRSGRALEHRLYDLRVQWAAARETPRADLILVAVDDASLARLEPAVGRWPWPRAVFAGLLDFCATARVIGMDVLFPEADWQYAGSDDLLAQQARDHGRLVTAVALTGGPAGSGAVERLHPFLLPAVPAPLTHPAVLLPYGALLDASAAVGHVNFTPDDDGTLRGYLVATPVPGGVLPSLALALAMRCEDLGAGAVRWGPSALELGGRRIPLDGAGRLLLCPAARRFRVVSAADVLDAWKGLPVRLADGQPLTRELFRDATVLVGSLATGLQADWKVTPFDAHRAGVEITATALDNLLTGRVYRRTPGWVSALLVLGLGLLPGIRRFDRPTWLATAGLAGAGLYVALVAGALAAGRWMLPASPPLLALLLSCVTLGLWYWYEERCRRRRLEELEQAKQQFTDMLVHDLKGRVATISLSAHMLETAAERLPPERRMMLAAIGTTAGRLLNDVHALLDIRKMEEGRLPVHKSRLELNGIVQAAVAALAPAATLSGVELRFVPGAPMMLDADSEMLDRVLGNLLWNAIEHAPAGSAVELDCRVAYGRAVVTVGNGGPALTVAQQELACRPFVSIAQTRARTLVGGTGLGLAFCRLAMETHDGRLEVLSPWRDGAGVCVRFSLPLPS